MQRSERTAARLRASELRPPGPHGPFAASNAPASSRGQTIWREFRARYEAEGMADLPASAPRRWRTAANAVESICGAEYLDDLTPDALAALADRLAADGVEAKAIRTYLTRIRHAMQFACRAGLIDGARFGFGSADPAPAEPCDTAA